MWGLLHAQPQATLPRGPLGATPLPGALCRAATSLMGLAWKAPDPFENTQEMGLEAEGSLHQLFAAPLRFSSLPKSFSFHTSFILVA